ncbi:MAG: leucine-rich repeat protein, partial [Candidatus Methanomethylophilaceae archaeon]|nr:leucine-rich repeat protein [Candidatus Methanomethylophilaceae archaeon]
MGSFADDGTSSVTGQKRLTILMAAAFIILSICFVGILFSDGTDASTDHEFVDGNIIYRVVSESDSTVMVFGSNYYETSTDVIIPDTVTHDDVEYKVITIGEFAFSSQIKVNSVTIGDNVRTIADYAFKNCSGLTAAYLPDSVEYIGKEAFFACWQMTSFTIPKGVTSIGDYAFSYCTWLTTMNVDSENTAYSSVDGVLFNKSGTELLLYPIGKTGTSYSVPADVRTIGNGAFLNTWVSSITFLGGVTSIGDLSFGTCRFLTSIALPNGLTSIGVAAFEGCDSLESASIPSGVESLSDSAFSGCSKLSSVTLPDDMTSICEKAFMDCKKLEGIDLPDNLETIGVYAFKGCDALESIVIPDKVTTIGSFHATQTSMNMGAFEDCTNLVSVTLGKSVELIGQRTFSGCSKLTGIVLPESVTCISNYAFYQCYGLTSIVIPGNVTEIGFSAFEQCNRMTSVEIGDGVKTIKGMAFANCNDVQTLVIGDNVSTIQSDALFKLDDLTDLTMPISLSLSNLPMYSHLINSKNVVNVKFTPGTGEGFDGYAANFQYDSLPWNDYFVGDTDGKKQFTLGFANGIDSLGGHDFDGFTFYDSDGVTLLSNTVADLCGYVYVGTYDRMVRQAESSYERTVSFDANGGMGTMDPITVFTFDRFYPVCTFTPPAGKVFLGWSLESDGDVLTGPIGVSEDVTLYAMWRVNKVFVTYLVDDKQVEDVEEYDIGATVQIRDRYVMEGYDVTDWKCDLVTVEDGRFTLGTEDVTFTADSTVKEYVVYFKLQDGTIVNDDDFIVQHFEVIVAPDDPVIAGTDTLSYNFVEWDGFTPGMTATGDATFVAVFIACPAYCPDLVEGDVEFDAEAVDELQLGTAILEEAKSMIGVSDSSVSILFNSGSISFDGQALSEMDGSETIAIKQMSGGDVPQNISSQVDGRPVFDVSVGDVHEFGNGKLTIRLKYALGTGESANNIKIWHYKADGSKVSEDCTYDENGGYVEFTTDNLSYFAIMYVEPTDNGGN